MNVFRIVYQVFCIAGALGMSLLCVHRFMKNESVVSVSYKVFHETPDDVYPSISICFQDARLGPFEDTNDIKKSEIADMMTGKIEYNQSLLGNLTYEDMTMKLQIKTATYRMVSGNTDSLSCANSKCLKTYGDGRIKCFTHDMMFKKNDKYQELVLRIKKNWVKARHVIKIFCHHPGQLFRNGLHHVIRLSSIQKANQIHLNIQSVTVLKKRQSGKSGCNSESSHEDVILFWNTVKLFNCTAKYS